MLPCFDTHFISTPEDLDNIGKHTSQEGKKIDKSNYSIAIPIGYCMMLCVKALYAVLSISFIITSADGSLHILSAIKNFNILYFFPLFKKLFIGHKNQ